MTKHGFQAVEYIDELGHMYGCYTNMVQNNVNVYYITKRHASFKCLRQRLATSEYISQRLSNR
jgi:serine/threonine protein kinase HipA of HipAB toxin-antitoxin module